MMSLFWIIPLSFAIGIFSAIAIFSALNFLFHHHKTRVDNENGDRVITKYAVDGLLSYTAYKIGPSDRRGVIKVTPNFFKSYSDSDGDHRVDYIYISKFLPPSSVHLTRDKCLYLYQGSFKEADKILRETRARFCDLNLIN